MRQFQDGGFGFLTATLAPPEEDAAQGAPDQAPAQAIVAFEDRRDAEQVQWLWDAWEAAEAGAGEDGGQNRRALLLTPAQRSPRMHMLRS